MIVIRNKLNQRIIVNLVGVKNIDLLAKGTAEVSKEDLLSPHLQALISRGDIVVMPPVSHDRQEEQGEQEKLEESKEPEETEKPKEIGTPKEVVEQPERQPKKKGKK
ncbi:hypothetical protein KKE26_12625 [bacterium]|nr:hypothetical protein [bacterium]MBU1754571.1 hypothetical protein [bacterium]